ncbi:MAG: radical SAM protein [Candidatus Omnitrophica bacterium]|nr:radical SAM protein [Candidatus Omnitrophota bacterium]MDD5652688.1 radical SAM protein [Candidatus Omnitrophota bacterium]
MKRGADIVLINPGHRKAVFQDLAADYSAIEPPFWIAAIAAYLLNKGFQVAVIDANAETISPEEITKEVKEIQPLICAVIVYGSQPSASTQNMTVAGLICRELKNHTTSKIALGGLHPSALPGRTMEEEAVDFVIDGEGPYTLASLLELLKANRSDYSKVPGLWYRQKKAVISNPRAALIKNLDEISPLAAWELLAMHKYRAHNWHCFDGLDNRMPYAAIYTSLGCPYACTFCCINAPFGEHIIRYRSPALVVNEIEFLVKKYGISNLKIVDELFIFNEEHYMAIVDLILEKGLDLNIWAYARIDTVNFSNLEKMKRAGINWLAVGIESASEFVRDGADKRIRRRDIIETVRKIQSAGINVVGNYIFGLPDDNHDTMQQTLDLALEINAEWANFYCAMAYPGSKLYEIALAEKWALPQSWIGFSQHAYETLPLPTKYLNAKEVLNFRDEAFLKYFQSDRYLALIRKKFGEKPERHIREVTGVKLTRKILQGE